MRRERWELPDGDFLDLDRLDASATGAPVLVICHGLEGSSRAPTSAALRRGPARGGSPWRP